MTLQAKMVSCGANSGLRTDKMSLLLLEFSSSTCRLLERNLRGQFGRVVAVTGWEKALESILDDSFDVLLLRWRGKVHSSLGHVLHKIRPRLAIVAALEPRFRTGYAAAFAAGVHDCVATPVNGAELHDRAANIFLRRDASMRGVGPVEPRPRSSTIGDKRTSRDAAAQEGASESPGLVSRAPSRVPRTTDRPDIGSHGSNSSRSSAAGPAPTALGRDIMSSSIGGSRGSPLFVAEHVVIDLRASRVWVDGTEVRLTMRSWQLLVYLLRRRGHIVSTAELGREAFNEMLDDSTLRDHVQRLRTTLGKAGSLIKTRRGRGYLVE